MTGTTGTSSGNINGAKSQIAGELGTANDGPLDVNEVASDTNVVVMITGMTAFLRGTLSDSTGALDGEAL